MKAKNLKMKKLAVAMAALISVPAYLSAEETGGYLLDSIEIIGTKDRAQGLPGSGYVVDAEQMKTEAIDDINQALKTVPGIYIREEDGYGLRPNIGIRGATSERSEKITLDGRRCFDCSSAIYCSRSILFSDDFEDAVD